jgi:hypothetical protein
MKTLIGILCGLALLVVATSCQDSATQLTDNGGAPLLAGSPHFKGRTPVTLNDLGTQLSATASYAGLGNFDVRQIIEVQGNATAVCTNPAGATQPPGQNPAPATFGGATTIPATDVKNGNLKATTTTLAPTSPIPNAPDCPNPKWTETITDVAFISPATIKLFQDSNGDGNFADPGELVLAVSCTFSPSPSTDGALSNVSCSQL